MPYPAKIQLDNVVETARTLIERDGFESLSLGQLADALGVKAPSLYRHVESKVALLRAINDRTIRALFDAFENAMRKTGDDPEAKMWMVFRAHREFAHANPITYVLAFSTSGSDGQRGNEASFVELVLPIQKLMEAVAGTDNALSALRGALALVHGFVMLELNQQFQQGGDLTEAFEVAVQAYLRGWRK